MLAVRSLRCGSVVSSNALLYSVHSAPVLVGEISQIQVRHAGGGGRPGAKPTFSWRERMELRLSKKNEITKKLRIKEFGDFDEDIAPFLDEGHVMKNITDINWDLKEHIGSEEEEKALQARLMQEADPYKKIQTSRLFGSHKSAGTLIGRESPKGHTFSHSRLFGDKKAEA